MFSVIVLSYNKRLYTERCLRSLLASTARPLEIWVVDNGSTDGTVEFLKAFREEAAAQGIEVALILNPTNVGAVRGRNQALEKVRGEYIAFLDNDVVVRRRRWLEGLRAALEAEERNGIVGPKLLFPWPPYPIECAGCEVTVGGRVVYRGRGRPREALEYNEPRECPCLISACWLMRRAVYEELGPLDEAFSPVQFEDVDYCYRARQKGWRVLYEPRVEMYHFENITTAGSEGIAFKRLTIKNGLLFKRRWWEQIQRDATLPDEAARWEPLPRRGVEEVGELPMEE